MQAAPRNALNPLGSVGSPRLAALINPLSFRMHMHQRAPRTADHVRRHGGRVYEVNGLADIQRGLTQAIDSGIERLVVAGGDGTLQATVTWLAKTLNADEFPELIVLSAGRTNYVASDIGTRRHFVDTLKVMLESDPDQLHPVIRSSVACHNPAIGEQHGFFLAGAMIDEIIRDVHRWQLQEPGRIFRQYTASTTGVISLMSRWALGLKRFELPELSIHADGLGSLESRMRFVLVTSLPLNHHAINPYAHRGKGRIRLTAVAHRARGLIRRLPNLVRGRFKPEMKPSSGYLSGNSSSIIINNIKSITVDGQEFDLDPAHPLEMREGPSFRFLRP